MPFRPRQTDLLCAGCGCLCDDIASSTGPTGAVEFRNACERGKSFLEGTMQPGSVRSSCRGSSTTLPIALQRAAEILRSAQHPLILLSPDSSVETSRAAVQLTEVLRGTIDIPRAPGERARLQALRQRGWPTCTLGELRDRADLIVFWNTDPSLSHPRFLERFLPEGPTPFLPAGRSDRRIVAVTSGGRQPGFPVDLVVPVADDGFTMARALRQLCSTYGSVANPPPEAAVRSLAQWLREARYAVICLSTAEGPFAPAVAVCEELIQLAGALNSDRRCSLLHLGGLRAAENVLTWQTGYPDAVTFTSGAPVHNPSGLSAQTLLDRGEVDAVVVVGSQSLAPLNPAELDRMRVLSVILLDAGDEACGAIEPEVHVTGLASMQSGQFHRLDGVPLESGSREKPAAAELLNRLRENLAHPAACG